MTSPDGGESKRLLLRQYGYLGNDWHYQRDYV
jgi:hypothetical protein